jgi:hypothetical protein
MIFDAQPSISAQPPAPSAYVCQVDRWCDPKFRGELANDLGESILGLLSHDSGPVSVATALGEATFTGFPSVVLVRPI